MKFKIGDKVRVIKEVVQNRYMLGEYEIITDIAPNHDVMGRCIKLAYPLNDKLEDDTMFEWREDELMYFDNDPIAALQEEIATLKAALDASNAALAEARKVIREIASNGLDISEGYRHVSYNAIVVWAKKQVASWDSAVATTTQDESESGE